MNIIHITGTKGKGSTGAFIESVLKRSKIGENRLKVGLFTSPHILQVRERIRIDGKPISQELFAKYFFQVWDRLENTESGDKPAYFRYLTLVCFHACMQENIDTLILEVGIGGEYDSTNVVEKPTCSVITSIGLDHVALLGDTEAKIAWHKAGIIKPGRPCVVAPQLDSVVSVVKERSIEKQCSDLVFVTKEDIDACPKELGLAGEHQRINAAVAIEAIKQHCKAMKLNNTPISLEQNDIKQGLKEAFWPGRCQRILSNEFPNIEWCLDGAHTPESLVVCTDWFKSITKEDGRQKVLIFNCTHSRMGKDLLPAIISSKLEFSKIIFCRNEPFTAQVDQDHLDMSSEQGFDVKVQQGLKDAFKELSNRSGDDGLFVVPSVKEAMDLVEPKSAVLVTGSLYLVAGMLTVLKQDI